MGATVKPLLRPRSCKESNNATYSLIETTTVYQDLRTEIHKDVTGSRNWEGTIFMIGLNIDIHRSTKCSGAPVMYQRRRAKQT